MQQKTKAVVFVGMSYPHGIIRHFALVASEGRKLAESDGIDYYFASTVPREVTNAGAQRAWDVIHQSFPKETVIAMPDLPGMVDRIAALFDSHEKIIVHFQGGNAQTQALIPLKKRFGDRIVLIAVVQYFRNDSWKRIPTSIYQYFLYSKYVDLVNFQSPYCVRKFWGGRRLFSMGKGVVIPMGCEEHPQMSDVVPDSLASSEVASTLLDPRLFKFVYLAAFRKGKRHEWLVRAMAPELRKLHHVRVLLCGMGFESVVNDVRAAIKDEGLSDQILLPGQIPHNDLPWLLSHCDAALIPSCSETFGHAFVEPMMAGLPILGTSVGAGEYVIREYETGFSFELSSPSSLRLGFRKMVEHRSATKRMGATAQKMAKLLFSFEEVAHTWHNVYRDFLGCDAEAHR